MYICVKSKFSFLYVIIFIYLEIYPPILRLSNFNFAIFISNEIVILFE